jgi:hypothetical protein
MDHGQKNMQDQRHAMGRTWQGLSKSMPSRVRSTVQCWLQQRLNHDRSSFLLQRVLVIFVYFYLVDEMCGLVDEYVEPMTVHFFVALRNETWTGSIGCWVRCICARLRVRLLLIWHEKWWCTTRLQLCDDVIRGVLVSTSKVHLVLSAST